MDAEEEGLMTENLGSFASLNAQRIFDCCHSIAAEKNLYRAKQAPRQSRVPRRVSKAIDKRRRLWGRLRKSPLNAAALEKEYKEAQLRASRLVRQDQ